jgi:UDP-glucuronate 4-epimerase
MIPALKNLRLASLKALNGSEFFCGKLAKVSFVNNVFQSLRPRVVVHLGAQAGVRYSLQTPRIYVDSNVVGSLNILESCRLTHLSHLVYASTSSYYGANPKLRTT